MPGAIERPLFSASRGGSDGASFRKAFNNRGGNQSGFMRFRWVRLWPLQDLFRSFGGGIPKSIFHEARHAGGTRGGREKASGTSRAILSAARLARSGSTSSQPHAACASDHYGNRDLAQPAANGASGGRQGGLGECPPLGSFVAWVSPVQVFYAQGF